MSILSNSKYFYKAYKTIPSTISKISISMCAVTWLHTPYKGVVCATDCLKYHSMLSEPYKRNNSSNFSMLTETSTSERRESNLQSSLIRLEDYDCIGFDLDNTICEYNLSSSVKMEYEVLSNFLVHKKGYDDILLKHFDAHSIDFLQKGLLIDFERGNILKIGENGVILRASHGTKPMSKEEIVAIYGKERKWHVTSEFSRNLLVAWDGPLSYKMRALLDYFDMPASLAFARIIDSLENNSSKTVDLYKVWADVKDGLVNMYNREHFLDGKGDYFKEIKENTPKFIKKCDPQVVEWLNKIKQSKVTFLITGSNCDFASLTAETCLGKDWRSLFDVVVCYARKPGFFTGCRPFVRLENCEEMSVIEGKNLKLGNMYSQGNWQELYQLFQRTLNKKQPKCLYFGDNLLQDVYTPSEYTKCDTVAVVEELSVESKAKSQGQSAEMILQSGFWGSYFYDSEAHLSTIWGSVIKNNAKCCIPSLLVLAQCSSFSHELPTFSNMSNLGYFPNKPISVI